MRRCGLRRLGLCCLTWVGVLSFMGCAVAAEDAALGADATGMDATVNADTDSGETDAGGVADGDAGPPIDGGGADLPAPNLPPVASDDTAATPVGETVRITALYNDFDPDGDWLTIEGATQGQHGDVEVIYGGTQLRYTAFEAAPGGADAFEYTVSDGRGGTAVGTVNVTVIGALLLTITSPTSGQVVQGPVVQIAFEVAGCEFTSPGANSQGCHAHKFLDGSNWSDPNGKGFGQYEYAPFDIFPVSPGNHTFVLQLIRNDGSDKPWSPPVKASVAFTVQ